MKSKFAVAFVLFGTLLGPAIVHATDGSTDTTG